MNRFDLEKRLVNFSLEVIKTIELLPKTKVANHLSNQLIRSGTSVSLNYGEAQSAESKKDFIHKMKIILKELRETMITMHLIIESNMIEKNEQLKLLRTENNELISIFVKSIETAERNLSKNIKNH